MLDLHGFGPVAACKPRNDRSHEHEHAGDIASVNPKTPDCSAHLGFLVSHRFRSLPLQATIRTALFLGRWWLMRGSCENADLSGARLRVTKALWPRLVEGDEIPYRPLMQTRHRYATLMLQKGAPIDWLQNA